jgi:hypothetical protein
MHEQHDKNRDPAPWHLPVAVEHVPEETGRHFDLAAAADVRAAVARTAGLRELPRLEAKFDVTRRGAGGLHVVGSVSATVGQVCVVTLEPLTNEIEETIDLVFAPAAITARKVDESIPEEEAREVKWDDPEPLVGGTIDLGAIATEFLILGLDPYPRAPGVVFEPPQNDPPDAGAFDALAALKKGSDGR